MIVNLITIKDVLVARGHEEIVHIRCKNCFSKGPVVNNHLNRVKDFIESGKPMLRCPFCGLATKVDPSEFSEIMNILSQGLTTSVPL